MNELLTVEQLQIAFPINGSFVNAVEDVNFVINRGEVAGLVGESGCGKSITSLAIAGLLEKKNIRGGRILFEGKDLLGLSERDLSQIRGKQISMIFQDPMHSLNPVLTVGNQLEEILPRFMPKKKKKKLALEMIRKTGINNEEKVYKSYPHLLSGGQQQRVMIAMALLCRPKLLIADEPTTALDVTTQAQILLLIRKLCAENGTAVLFVTHDMGVISKMADHVIVMYSGHVVEKNNVWKLFDAPVHPYTRGLLRSIPGIHNERDEKLKAIKGSVPGLENLPKGCRFADRCENATDFCREKPPPLKHTGANEVRCWLHFGTQEEKESPKEGETLYA
jgi:peptide/nickel transport system ATP-binding protein